MGDGVQASDLIGAARVAGFDLTDREAESYLQTLNGLLAAVRALKVPQEVEPAAAVTPPKVDHAR